MKFVKIFCLLLFAFPAANFAQSTPENLENIDKQLDYINQQFEKFNNYNTRFFVDQRKEELIWIADFGEARVSLKEVIFSINHDKGWLIFDCITESAKCITFTSATGKSIQYKEYSMSLTQNDKIIEHIDDVVKNFETLKNFMTN